MYAIDWSTWRKERLQTAISQVSQDLTFQPLATTPLAQALWCQEGCGIYVFHDSTFTPLYVGKVSSRSFLERISAHMDTHGHKGGGPAGWFNTFHQRWVLHRGEADVEAKHNYLHHTGLLLLRIPHGDAGAIERVERALIHTHDPPLNRRTQIREGTKHWPLLEGLARATVEEVAAISEELLTPAHPDWQE